MTSITAEQIATGMGRRAAAHFRDLGTPTRNPFPATQPLLAAAWRTAYVDGAVVPASTRHARRGPTRS